MKGNTIVPGWIIFTGATLVALLFVGGLVGLLLEGRTVPEQMWILLGVIMTAFFGGGPFYQALAHAQTTTTQSRDTVVDVLRTTSLSLETANHGIAALREAVSGLTATHGTGPTGTDRNSGQ